jgi:hypothetical protein
MEVRMFRVDFEPAELLTIIKGRGGVLSIVMQSFMEG